MAEEPLEAGPGVEPQADQDRIWEDACYLASLRRLTGTADFERAARYIKERLEAHGVAVDILGPEVYVSHPGEAALSIVEPGGRLQQLACLTHAGAVSADGLQAETVVWGSGSVAGKVAVAEGLADPSTILAAQDGGAVGIIFVNRGTRLHELGISPVWGNPSTHNRSLLVRIPVLSVGRDEGLALLEPNAPRTVRLSAAVHSRWAEVPLVVATINGQRQDDGWVLVGGHLDGWHLGAMDNAFGNAACMEIARLFQARPQPPRRPVKVAWWPGHSDARFAGSAWFVDHFWRELTQGCVAYLNVDQPGFKEFHEFRLMATPEIAAYCREQAVGAGYRVPSIEHVGRHADMSFLGAGIPSCDFQPRLAPGHEAIAPDRTEQGLPWYWHHTDDTIDKGDPSILRGHTALLYRTAAGLAGLETVPYDLHAYVATFEQALAGVTASDDVQRLKRAVASFRSALERRWHSAPADPARRNRVALAVSRALIPALHSPGDRFDHWPALHTPLLPGLHPEAAADADRPYVETARVRYVNRVEDALARATETVLRL